MSSGAVAIATAATQHKQDNLTLTIFPVVFHMYKYNSDQVEIIIHRLGGKAIQQHCNRRSSISWCALSVTR